MVNILDKKIYIGNKMCIVELNSDGLNSEFRLPPSDVLSCQPAFVVPFPTSQSLDLWQWPSMSVWLVLGNFILFLPNNFVLDSRHLIPTSLEYRTIAYYKQMKAHDLWFVLKSCLRILTPDNSIMKSTVQNRIHNSTFRCDILYISLSYVAF